MHFPMSPR